MNRNDEALTIMGQIMMEIQVWLNNTPQPEFELREKDYQRWLINSSRLNSFSDPSVKQFKQKFDQLIYSMRPIKALFFGTLYTCSTQSVRLTYSELADIHMKFALSCQ